MEKTTSTAPIGAGTGQGPRQYYVDNLRIFLIILVILHHLIITYGAPGGWYYKENEPDQFYILPFAMFVATNQAFFMGFFFLISAYFTPASYDRKGPGAFLKDRLLRLGIPLLVFFFVLSPIMIYFLSKYARGMSLSFGEFLIEHQGFSFGPMWFVETLLYFTVIYLSYRLLFFRQGRTSAKTAAMPGDGTILLFALAIGAGSFLVRVWLPVGWQLDPLGLQFPHFLQYIASLILGVVIYRHNWLEAITYRRGVKWFIIAQVFIFLLFPALFIAGGAPSGEIDVFMGGLHWQSFAYCLWEQVVGFSLMIGLIGIFREHFNQQGTLASKLSASAYTVYIIHPLILVFLALAFRSLDLYPPLKFLLLAPLAVGICFFLANLIRQAPYARNIL